MWKQLSEELAAAAAQAGKRLVHVGSEAVAGRTGLMWSTGVVVTLAREANDGEAVPVVLPGGATASATVRAFDPRTGLCLLNVPAVTDPGWKHGPTPPVGSLALAVAFPSPQGVEARLDLVRFVGGPNEWGRGVSLQALLQTDGAAWPGFAGSALVDADGALVGFVAENRQGNGGFAVTTADLARLIESLVTSGSPKQAWLGVSTKPAAGQGLVLVSVEPGSPADKAGWKAGDLLVSLAGSALREPAELVRMLAGLEPGKEVSAKVLRDAAVHERPVVTGSR